MERLTKREPNGQALYLACKNCKNAKYGDYCVNCENRIEHCRRLAEYEDTGLTPDEIEEMKQTLAELEWEIERSYEIELGDDL